MNTPVVGQPYQVNEYETIVPSRVDESEAPAPNGACLTADLVELMNRPFVAAGWYVEFSYYPDHRSQYRRFIPFPT